MMQIQWHCHVDLKRVVAQLVLELWRWNSRGSFTFQAAVLADFGIAEPGIKTAQGLDKPKGRATTTAKISAPKLADVALTVGMRPKRHRNDLRDLLTFPWV